MKRVNELRESYIELEKKSGVIYSMIDTELNKQFIYNGVGCYVTGYDLEDDYINIHPIDGETTLSTNGKNLGITFKQFDAHFGNRKYKIHFYKGKEAFGDVLEFLKTVEVDFDYIPKSDSEIIKQGLKELGSYPKSYTAKIYEIK